MKLFLCKSWRKI